MYNSLYTHFWLTYLALITYPFYQHLLLHAICSCVTVLRVPHLCFCIIRCWRGKCLGGDVIDQDQPDRPVRQHDFFPFILRGDIDSLSLSSVCLSSNMWPQSRTGYKRHSKGTHITQIKVYDGDTPLYRKRK